MFNFNHLYYFYITAKCDGISKASKFLRIAQPSLSSQLHTLEAQLNVTLFQREGRRMVLTEAGRTAFAYCRKIFEAADEFKDFLSKGDGASGTRVTLGVCNEIERPFVVELVSQILTPRGGSRAPRVTMISGTHSQMKRVLSEAPTQRPILVDF